MAGACSVYSWKRLGFSPRKSSLARVAVLALGLAAANLLVGASGLGLLVPFLSLGLFLLLLHFVDREVSSQMLSILRPRPG